GGAFQECIAVVVRGRMLGDAADPSTWVFHGDELEVKHGNDYQERTSGDRPTEAEERAEACRLAAAGSL
ncbi:MAG TPA: hypothetical protein PLV68_06795, partial [Ilumatobacteraceae bacterium]|nr:hypothetical protein [Ilumatobacteraceae bacterium]